MVNKFSYIVDNFRIGFEDKERLNELLCEYLSIEKEVLVELTVLKESLDARQHKINIFYQHRIRFNLTTPLKEKPKNVSEVDQIQLPNEEGVPTNFKKHKRPLVVGYGPAGMFLAFTLIEAGIKPIIIEKGQTGVERQKSINQLWKNSILDENSNVQFGEGGAGFFSDGKLGTRVKSSLIQDVYKIFVRFGAKEEILYQSKPHLGTDKLRIILKSFRTYLIEQGATFQFQKTVEKIKLKNKRVIGVTLDDGAFIEADDVFLCTGHSCRDIYRMLHANNVSMESKEFAVGFRVEHPQEFINKSQFGHFFDNSLLPAADYKLTTQSKKSKQGVYSFCMCPGGMVVLATSEKNKIVTNGMSLSHRDGKLANAGIVVAVNKEFLEPDLFAGIRFQEEIEAKAYSMTNSYFAPAQRIQDFMDNQVSTDLPKSSFLPGLKSCNLRQLYPEWITEKILAAVKVFEEKFPGFIHADGIFIAPETRTSSPIKILRNPETYESINTIGLYPLGEGAGASGGITSSAIEGIHGARKWIKKYSNI
ncbi:MAG: hypothetical protein COA79_16275 [Planctomycetota bacterium]|nr:MAG: hypothetical protein COA79_16275 [Planctomycetota bacterium]